MINDVTWITSFGATYYENVAKYNLPGWSMLEGHKIAMVDDMPGFKYKGIEIIDAGPAYPSKTDPHWAMGGTKKGKFWKKGKCFLWAIRKSKTRWVIWLDSDVKILAPIDLNRFWPKDGDVVSLICGNLKQAESGFVIVDTHHPLFKEWTNEYEQCWYNGIIDTLHRPWDNDVLWYVCKKLPHRNLSKSVTKSPQGFEDTDLLDYMYHYSGKRQKELVKE